VTTVDRSEWRWRSYPRAVVLALLLAVFVMAVTADEGAEESLQRQLGGDLPTFWAAGDIVRSGDGDRLYDLDRQFEAQAGFWEREEMLLLYVYPPVLAVPYVPLSAVDYRLAYLVHTAAMFGVLVLTVRLASDLIPLLADHRARGVALTASLLFLPMFVGSMLGQVTALFLLALTATWWGLAMRRDLVAALGMALLMLKPQYGVPVLGLVFLARRWRALGLAVVGLAVLWLASIVVSGPTWHTGWYRLVRNLSTLDTGSNLSNEVSILGLAEVVFGAGSSVAFAIWMVATAAIVTTVLWRLRQRPPLDPHALALVPPMLLLIAPHALYYDAALLLLSLGLLLPTVPPRRRVLLLAVWFVGGLSHLVSDSLGVQPVALLVFGTFAWAWWASDPRRAPARAEEIAPARS
jgi:alpha-1,2-mannosyltransferase